MIKVNIKIDSDQIVEIVECHTEVKLNMDRIIEEGGNKVTEVKISEVDIEVTNRNEDFGRSRISSGERQYSSNFRKNNQSSCRSRSGLRASTYRDRIRYFKCREYDDFAKDCPNSDIEKEQSEQMQQMFNLKEDKDTVKGSCGKHL